MSIICEAAFPGPVRASVSVRRSPVTPPRTVYNDKDCSTMYMTSSPVPMDHIGGSCFAPRAARSTIYNDKAVAVTGAIGYSTTINAACATNVAFAFGTTTGARTMTQKDQLFTGLTRFLSGALPETVLEELDSKIDVSHAACVGKGTFGNVISAYTRTGHQQVAIKVLPHRQAGIQQEVTTLRDLSDHPNLVQMIGVMKCSHSLPGVSKQAPFVCVIMEFVADSAPLAQRIYVIGNMYKTAGDSATQQWVHAFAVSVTGSVASALAFMHQRGYVHRDVWSENILVDKAGKTVLCDLGSAERHDITECRRTEMNIPYMSPAAWQGLEVAPGDDCWALGLVLSEIVTGKLMNQRLAGNTSLPVHTNALALQELKRDTAQRCPELSPICERMLSKFLRADMKEIAEQLRAALPDMSSDTRSISQGTEVASATSTASASSLAPSSVVSSSQKSLLADLVTSPSKVGCSTSFSIASCYTSSSISPTKTGSLEPGMRVKYLARSNSIWYAGVLLGRGSSGWRVSLDCGETKEVDDRWQHRLTKEETAVADGPAR